MSRHLRPSVCGVLGVLCFCSSSPRAVAEVRSFAGIREIVLEPALPGTEGAHRELAAFLENQRVGEQLSGPPPALRPEASDGLAHCTLRNDLAKPRPLGLECRDRRGQYIGTLRARSLAELRGKLTAYRDEGAPGARPLNEFWYIYVKPVRGAEWASDYAAELLRADGRWRVVQSPEQIPESVRSRLLVCSVEPGGVVEYPVVTPKIYSYLMVSDAAGNTVRHFRAGSPSWLDVRLSVKAAVDGLIQRRSEDEETHRPLPAGRREPR